MTRGVIVLLASAALLCPALAADSAVTMNRELHKRFKAIRSIEAVSFLPQKEVRLATVKHSGIVRLVVNDNYPTNGAARRQFEQEVRKGLADVLGPDVVRHALVLVERGNRRLAGFPAVARPAKKAPETP